MLLRLPSLLVVVLISPGVFSTNALHSSSLLSNGEKNSVKDKQRNIFPSSTHAANQKTPNPGETSSSPQRARDLLFGGFDPLAFLFGIIGSILQFMQSILSFITFGLISPPVVVVDPGFDIQLDIHYVPEEDRIAFLGAKTRWEEVIVGDLSDQKSEDLFPLFLPPTCDYPETIVSFAEFEFAVPFLLLIVSHPTQYSC